MAALRSIARLGNVQPRELRSRRTCVQAVGVYRAVRGKIRRAAAAGAVRLEFAAVGAAKTERTQLNPTRSELTAPWPRRRLLQCRGMILAAHVRPGPHHPRALAETAVLPETLASQPHQKELA